MPISTAVAALMQVSKLILYMAGMQWVNTLIIIINQKEAQINHWKEYPQIPEHTPTSMCIEHNMTTVLQAERLAHTHIPITTGFEILMAVTYEECSLLACNVM
jgi:hypothetical protein